ncbi:MAG: hydrogenase assembly protein HupF [Thermoprotei archaeon]|nr:MAG: hydrogenase assembly protein HupF [Thermoprotei archaeon]
MSRKLSPDLLEKYIFNRIGRLDSKVILGPRYGEDAAIINLDNKYLVMHTDPITGAVKNIGWLAVNIVSNDIAVRGVKPRWILLVILLPMNFPEKDIDAITRQIDKAAREIGAMIIGGHTEFTVDIERPIISATAIGVTSNKNIVKTCGVKDGDYILMTKGAGLEGTSILATDFEEKLREKGVSEKIILNAKNFINEISVVREALILSEYANSMHDPTEGGILNGLAEMAYASNIGIDIWIDKILIREETKIICRKLDIDPLRLISSGVLLASIPPNNLEKSRNVLDRERIPYSIIGRAGGKRCLRIYRDGELIKTLYDRYYTDELEKIWRAK